MNLFHELREAVFHHQSGRLDAAHLIYAKILSRFPHHPDALHLSGLISHQRGDLKRARERILRAIGHNPFNPTYHNNMGAVARAEGEMTEAENCYRQALRLDEGYAEAWYNLGTIHHTAGRRDGAISCYRKAVHHDPCYVDAWNNLAAALNETGAFEAAMACCRKIFALDAAYAPAYNNLAHALKETGQQEGAVRSYQRALSLAPDQWEYHNNIANLYMEMGAIQAAIDHYQKALSGDPDSAIAHNGLGTALLAQGHFIQALSCFTRSVDLGFHNGDGYHNLGNTYMAMGQYAEALSCYEKSIQNDPRRPESYLNMGIAYREMGRHQKAYRCYIQAIRIDPGHEKAYSHIVHYLMQSCDWQPLTSYSEKLDRMTRSALEAGKTPMEMPFLNLARTDDLHLNHALARSWSAEIETRCPPLERDGYDTRSIESGWRTKKRCITIGYLSNNFKNHPTAHLTAGIFACHDRERFQVHCYSYGEDDQSSYRKRIRRTCDGFIDIRDMDHLAAAKRIADDGVDILIDMVGYMKGNRIQIPAFRPAPIQVRWLGMAGTTGASFFDYLLTHSIVTPERHAPYYTESLVYLPDCYQVNDRDQQMSTEVITRTEMRLPADAFVFCCFSTHYKITKELFGIWMNLLKRTANSVLWLLKGNGRTMENLVREARSHGVGRDRIVFAEKISKERHLRRLQHADLALDTLAVNGAATTSDALWSGVPVITMPGRHFASRMSSCILSAVGMPEMVVHDLTEYESLSYRLATQPDLLLKTKKKLNRNRDTLPLFNTKRFVRNLESAYRVMWDRYRNGEKVGSFYVVPPYMDGRSKRHNSGL